MSAIEVHCINKKVDDSIAVEDLSLGEEEGEVPGLLGPDGAGKTTTLPW